MENPGFDYFVYNLGISGNTTEDLIERFAFETRQRAKGKKEIIIIFAIGLNDSCFVDSKNNFGTSPKKFKENLENLIKLSSKFTSKIVFVGSVPVDELKVNPMPWDVYNSYKNEHIKKYDDIIKSICQENSIYFIDIFSEFNKLDYKKLLEDGVHPNSEGHQKMFKIVKDFLVEHKIIDLK